jgi:hypothetical protein
MSSTESSGAPAEATATNPAPAAGFPTFGSTRGSGLARGKRPSVGPATASAPVATDYKPTAIEVVTAPREYQNPFAPAESPAAAAAPAADPIVTPESSPADIVPVAKTDPVTTGLQEPAPVSHEAPLRIEPDAGSETDEPAELNILEAEQKKSAPAQTWESEGFRPAREPRGDRPRREESRREEPRREESAPVDIASIPEKFLYVRPGVTYVPTPSNYGGAPRERHGNRGSFAAPAASAPAEAPAKSGGFLGWLKSLFGGSPEAAPAEAHSGEHRHDDRPRGGGGRGRGQGQGGGDGYRRRHRGGRGRSRGEFRGDQGTRSGGPAN